MKNNRVKEVKIILDHKDEIHFSMEDRYMGLQVYELVEPITCESIEIIIVDVYDGYQYSDTCIGEKIINPTAVQQSIQDTYSKEEKVSQKTNNQQTQVNNNQENTASVQELTVSDDVYETVEQAETTETSQLVKLNLIFVNSKGQPIPDATIGIYRSNYTLIRADLITEEDGSISRMNLMSYKDYYLDITVGDSTEWLGSIRWDTNDSPGTITIYTKYIE